MSIKSLNEDYGNYLWRGGTKIVLDKVADRFTVIPSTSNQADLLSDAPGVQRMTALSKGVFRVETKAVDRDAAMSAIRSEAFNGIVHHAYRPSGSEGTIFYITDTILVRFNSDTHIERISQLFQEYALKVVQAYEHQANTYLVQVTKTSGQNPLKIANRLAEEQGVAFAEPNLINRFQHCFTPTDPLFRRQWHLDAANGAQVIDSASVHAPEAWEITKGSRSIVVAIIDDGFDLTHSDLRGADKIVFASDYVDNDTMPLPDAAHKDYHGTPCAGVAIAEMNGLGVVGAAPGCAFMPVRFPLKASDDELIDIFQTVGQHADVISCSWGPPPVYAPMSSSLSDSFTQLTEAGGARGRGCVICFAAANFNAPLNDPINSGGFIWQDYETGQLRRTTGPILNGLAAHPDVVAVAASTSLNQHAAYSNWGTEISVCAPSNNFHPLDPQAFVEGLSIWTIDNEQYGSGFTPNNRFTGDFGGTSSATPLTAGVAALILSANPNLTAREVKQILKDTADKIVDTNPDVVTGEIRGFFDASGRCDWFGHGKINAARAVEESHRRLA